ncbi:MAG TPA: alpha-mannosidase, partial [Microbacterium sp.]|nr:alpha-mannosidase [Microbacterium sp.]
GRYRPVRGVDLSQGSVHLYADVAHNGFILYEVGRARYHGAYLAECDETAFALYYDYLTLVVLAGATEDAALERGVREAIADAYARFRAGDAAGARAALAPHLAAPSTSEFTYTAIGHGHLDMAWLWPLRETHRKAARTYTRQLANLEAEPDFRYGTSQPQQLQWMKDEQPALFARLRAAVAAGRIEPQGAFWVEPDTNLPSGESLIRQALHGRRFWEEELGVAPDGLRVCWLPDTFGYSGNLPQILRGTGMEYFQTIKLAWNKVTTFPYRTFRWEGIDGSQVLVHMPPEGDYNSRGAADGLLTGIRQYPERDLGTALLVFGSGDGGGGPGEIHLELQRRERSLRGLPKVTPGTADGFFRALDERIAAGSVQIPHHRGELYLETHQGTYTTAVAAKRLNRRCERLLHEAEALAALTGTPARESLDPLWRSVLLNQFHDIIPGSSIERVNREAVETYERVEVALEADIRGRIARLPTSGDVPTALNLTSFPRREHVRVGDEWHVADVGPYAAAPLVPAPP